MKQAVTKRQKELLSIIYRYVSESGYPPTFEEMREGLEVTSNQSVVDHLKGLVQFGCIRKSESAARGITILPFGYDTLGRPPFAPILGTTMAGAPAEAIELAGEWQTLPGDVAKFAEDIFLLKVSGDSMINAGIDDGDAVLVQTKKEFVSGDIVYAQIGEEGTIKRFMSDDKPPFVYLKPENPNYQLIPFTHEMELKGKVMSILKNNQWSSVK
ncbi:MAG: repressor LexA [Candidatus Magasanikbacteria bacterium RIFCSPHIGHO2_02_FULL_51_14]|uniref:Repressor LexA n=1 Tax=Candidatus Magasanikbacteria bacterium RIFCSPHIGHO2_02_FULL_51_14 TaxID=1798683 RepID=A0A1F6MR48_9BACT|nr:MAG: repressor LexA [Candidatus Magasanikbacteria bacterium RIFCSPHIGHO2_02_FULL_51_14]